MLVNLTNTWKNFGRGGMSPEMANCPSTRSWRRQRASWHIFNWLRIPISFASPSPFGILVLLPLPLRHRNSKRVPPPPALPHQPTTRAPFPISKPTAGPGSSSGIRTKVALWTPVNCFRPSAQVSAHQEWWWRRPWSRCLFQCATRKAPVPLMKPSSWPREVLRKPSLLRWDCDTCWLLPTWSVCFLTVKGDKSTQAAAMVGGGRRKRGPKKTRHTHCRHKGGGNMGSLTLTNSVLLCTCRDGV
mmetsp:Transcript_16877/g.49130  ORF Transcript_16877/g.49130 Transcript_16877/m.49130 type:complete len:244 (+) Transcript_16877:1563-2294(+)